jgi:hypothetical protein
VRAPCVRSSAKPPGERHACPDPCGPSTSIRARRGPQIAATALARKLATLFWHLLTREEDDAFAMPSTVRRKRRALELAAGDPPHKGRCGSEGPWMPGPAQRPAEWEVALGAEAAYRQMMADWRRTKGAGATTGERL